MGGKRARCVENNENDAPLYTDGTPAVTVTSEPGVTPVVPAGSGALQVDLGEDSSAETRQLRETDDRRSRKSGIRVE